MNSMSLSRPHVQFQGWHKRTNESLKSINAGDTLFLRSVNTHEARPENQVRYEAVKVVRIEGHQGRAYNPDTMSLTEADIDTRNGSRSSSNDSICVENQQPPAEIDENNFDQLRQNNIPWDHVDMVTFVDSQGQQKSMLYGEYLKKDYRSHKSERVKTHVYGYDTQLRELLTPDEFAKHTHTVRSNLTEKVNQLAAKLNALNGLFKGNLDDLVAKVLNTNVL